MPSIYISFNKYIFIIYINHLPKVTNTEGLKYADNQGHFDNFMMKKKESNKLSSLVTYHSIALTLFI